jgi:hypothetical protein
VDASFGCSGDGRNYAALSGYRYQPAAIFWIPFSPAKSLGIRMPPPDFPQPENNLGLPVKYLVKRTPVFVEPVATVAQAARTMHEALIGSVGG